MTKYCGGRGKGWRKGEEGFPPPFPRFQAFYGVPGTRCNGRNVETDHLIPLELGGSNELSNLWPQPYRPAPGAREKDVLEKYLHRQVCSGQMEIEAAQQAISQDWFSAWKQMVTSPH